MSARYDTRGDIFRVRVLLREALRTDTMSFILYSVWYSKRRYTRFIKTSGVESHKMISCMNSLYFIGFIGYVVSVSTDWPLLARSSRHVYIYIYIHSIFFFLCISLVSGNYKRVYSSWRCPGLFCCLYHYSLVHMFKFYRMQMFKFLTVSLLVLTTSYCL